MFKTLLICTGMAFCSTAAALEGLPEPANINLLAVQTPHTVPERIALDKHFTEQLRQARPGQVVELDGLVEKKGAQPLPFKRVQLYAPGAQVIVMGKQGKQVLPVKRRFFLAKQGMTAAGLAMKEDGTLQGMLMEQGELYELKQEGKWLLTQRVKINVPGLSTQCQTGDAQRVPSIEHTLNSLKGQYSHNLNKGTTPNYSTVVAVDTDTEWLNNKFSGNATAAQQWVEDAFTAMNVFYNRDLSLFLQLGTVILRTSNVANAVDGTSDGTLSNDLNAFGQYWMNNMGAVSRDFATMFSGKVSANLFSGLAWINSYCNNGISCNGGTATCGSYSFNAIGANPAITPAWASTLIGHELGHNLGSPHTHCYSTPIDNCYSGETYAGHACYSGPTSCPGGGKGTIMSYCHLNGCGDNKAEFHPTVISNLSSKIVANYPSCIDDYTTTGDVAFADGFEGTVP